MFRRLILLFLMVCFIQTSCYAKKLSDNKLPSVKYNGKQYSLLYSVKVKESNGYSNEYYKNKEGYNNWSELIGVHHFPTDFSPVDKAKEFQTYLLTMGVLSEVTTDEDDNTASIDFVVIDGSRRPIIMEFNIFKYQKDKICGTIALQYAKRYTINNSLDVENVKKKFEKERARSLKEFTKLEFLELITKEIENGKYLNTPTSNTIELPNLDKNELTIEDIKNEGIINSVSE